MPAGNLHIVAKVDTIEALQAEIKKADGFTLEKDLCDFVEMNIAKIAVDLFGSPLESYKREWCPCSMKPYALDNRATGGFCKPRIDFLLCLQNKERIGIECKNPKKGTFTDLVKTMSQLLAYDVLADQYQNPLSRLAIITTGYNPVVLQVIKKYNLPIQLFIMNKTWRTEVI